MVKIWIKTEQEGTGPVSASLQISNDFQLNGSLFEIDKSRLANNLVSTDPATGITTDRDGKLVMNPFTYVPVHQKEISYPAINVTLDPDALTPTKDFANGAILAKQDDVITVGFTFPSALPTDETIVRFNPFIKHSMFITDGILTLGSAGQDLALDVATVAPFEDPTSTFEITITSNTFGTVEYTSATDKRVLPGDIITQGAIVVEVFNTSLVYEYPEFSVDYKWIFNGDMNNLDELYTTVNLDSNANPLFVHSGGRDATSPLMTTHTCELILPITVDAKDPILYNPAGHWYQKPMLICKFKASVVPAAYTDELPIWELGCKYWMDKLGMVFM